MDNFYLDFGIDFTTNIGVSSQTYLDLLPLVPEKFRSSEILQALVVEAGLMFGGAISKTEGLSELVSPNSVSTIQYLRYLGALIGATLPPEDDTTLAELRKILIQTVDWYKIKGTYKSIRILAQALGYTINVQDMYTDDYSSFVLKDWFVGDEGENPTGLTSDYYKSPHFGVEIVLNKTYTVDSSLYLWPSGYLNNFQLQLEETRPVHTVPHYFLKLNPQTDEFGNKIEVSGEILAKITSGWSHRARYFDATNSEQNWSFDDGVARFDEGETSFVKAVTKWSLGTGSLDLDSDPTDLDNTVLSGTISADDITIYQDRYVFEFIVPLTTELDGITELGLFLPGVPDTLVAAASFPKIDLEGNSSLRVVFEVWKKNLI